MKAECTRCHRAGSATYVQRRHEGVLTFSVSFLCERGGNHLMADGDDTPADIRRALIEDGGEWEVVRPGVGDDPVALARALMGRNLFNARDAIRLSKQAPDRPLATGTMVEMTCFAANLRHSDVAVDVRPARKGSRT